MNIIGNFFSAIKHQIWRRFYYFSKKDEILETYKTRKGECKRCGKCCKPSFRCANLTYDYNGRSCCKINGSKPQLCKLYPFNDKDFFKHLRSTCGYRYDDD